MFVIVEGITIDSKVLQLKNIPDAIVVIPDGKVIDFNCVQP
jgi:hypothetical protein